METTELIKFYLANKQPTKNKRTSVEVLQLHNQCQELWERDYVTCPVSIAPSFCSSYPSTLFLPLAPRHCPKCSARAAENPIDLPTLESLLKDSSNGRARGRFIAPCILSHTSAGDCDSNFVLRSGALIEKPELLIRSLQGLGPSDLSLARAQDRNVMKQFGVRVVCDLMVEDQLSKCFGLLKCVSSEKALRSFYSQFTLLALPFPGWELFAQFKKDAEAATKVRPQGESREHLSEYPEVFRRTPVPLNGDAALNAAEFERERGSDMGIRWDERPRWDIVSLTLNYLSLLLSELERPSDSHEGLLPLGHGGLLIHCISGWDRTPLFVALLRLSLWANGRAHLSLSADEMVFFVIAYDWLLFGHDLHTRFSQSVELLYFSFFVLSKSAVPSNEERIGALFSSFLSSYGSIQY